MNYFLNISADLFLLSYLRQSREDLASYLIWIGKQTLFTVKAKYLSLAVTAQTKCLKRLIKDQCHPVEDDVLLGKLLILHILPLWKGNEVIWEKTEHAGECIQIHPAPLWSYPKNKQGKKRKERRTGRGHMVYGAPQRIPMGTSLYKYVNKHQGLVSVTCKTSQSISLSN